MTALLRRLTRNWPLKLTSLLLAILLWVVATLEEPVTRYVRARLELEPPAGRELSGAPPTVTVRLAGAARELLKLGGRPVTVTKTVTDTAEGRLSLPLETSDVLLPRGVQASVVEVLPATVPVRVMGVGAAALITVRHPGIPVLLAGPLTRHWHAVPETVTVDVRGPRGRLTTLPRESLVVVTVPDTLAGAAALRVVLPAGLSGEARPAAVRLLPGHP
ncbi:MAG TPA: hypothetical protein VFS07_07165 [Gemmatimonadales bacterium]|nr:hypothetical protein [Gemmatimonadales bacterium]